MEKIVNLRRRRKPFLELSTERFKNSFLKTRTGYLEKRQSLRKIPLGVILNMQRHILVEKTETFSRMSR